MGTIAEVSFVNAARKDDELVQHENDLRNVSATGGVRDPTALLKPLP